MYAVRAPPTPNTSKPRSKGRFSQGRPRFGKTPRGVVPSAGTNWHDPDAMVLDNINKGNGFNKDKKQYGKKITCYNCQKEGHMARDCRSKNKVVRQLNMMTKNNDMDEEWNIVHKPTIQVNTKGIVNGLEDLTVTTTESMDVSTPDDEVTKYEKQEQFKLQHRPATPCPKRFPTLDDKINELRRQLNKPEITFASIKDNIHIELEKYYQYVDLLDEVGKLQKDQLPLTTEEKDWTDHAMQSWDNEQAKHQSQKRKAEDINQANNTKHWMDYHNPKHTQLSWTACGHDHCTIHYSDKAGGGWYPKKVKGSPKCKWQWFDCINDQCAKHLWDKRTTLFYPGHDDPQEIMQMQVVELKKYDNGEAWECEQPTWHTCLSPDCDLHAIVKDFHRFGNDSFLGQPQGHKNPRKSTQ
jgi:hypothetical protein